MDFVRKRLQVFVSSTFSDLIPDRQAAVEAILTAGHIPAGMELFTAGDESQMEVIKQWIDESDVYLVIVGGRYGSVEPESGKSYTQLEYEYALQKNKPLFACVINDDALEARVKTTGSSVMEKDNPKEMKNFRSLVMSKMVRFWDDSKDIKIAIGETLAHFMRRDDLRGWIRECDQANVPALADEVARLSKENAELRGRLSSQEIVSDFAGLGFHEFRALLAEKGFLEKLTTELPRTHFAGHFQIVPGLSRVELAELCMLGFFQMLRRERRGNQLYELSDDGKRFLNRIDLEKLAASED